MSTRTLYDLGQGQRLGSKVSTVLTYRDNLLSQQSPVSLLLPKECVVNSELAVGEAVFVRDDYAVDLDWLLVQRYNRRPIVTTII